MLATRTLVCRSLVAASLALAATTASAQSWPSKTVRIVVPHTAGAPFDGELRQFAQSMSQAFGQPFVLDNRDGADGAIGAHQNNVRQCHEDFASLVKSIAARSHLK